MIYILPNDKSPAIFLPGPDILLSSKVPKNLTKFITVFYRWGLARRVSLMRGRSIVMSLEHGSENDAWSDEAYWTLN